MSHSSDKQCLATVKPLKRFQTTRAIGSHAPLFTAGHAPQSGDLHALWTLANACTTSARPARMPVFNLAGGVHQVRRERERKRKKKKGGGFERRTRGGEVVEEEGGRGRERAKMDDNKLASTRRQQEVEGRPH